MPFAFYNDTDEYCCAWLENLISARIIPYGIVDWTPIQKLKPATLAKFTQVHLFAGMGGWAYALRLVGWPDAKPVWTGSCPCQPFSVAGKRKAQKDSPLNKREIIELIKLLNLRIIDLQEELSALKLFLTKERVITRVEDLESALSEVREKIWDPIREKIRKLGEEDAQKLDDLMKLISGPIQ
jgi:site-specific DNA-cytosine methylase